MRFAFQDCVLDVARRELTRQAAAVAIGPQAFDLLVYLVQNSERVVSKDDVLDAVWKGRAISELTLTSHINAVRKAIGDSGGEQRLVRTIPRKGFRFVADVRTLQSPDHEPDRGSLSQDLQPSDELSVPEKPSIAVLPFQNSQWGRRTGIFLRWRRGGDHLRSLSRAMAIRHRAKLELRVPGETG